MYLQIRPDDGERLALIDIVKEEYRELFDADHDLKGTLIISFVNDELRIKKLSTALDMLDMFVDGQIQVLPMATNRIVVGRV